MEYREVVRPVGRPEGSWNYIPRWNDRKLKSKPIRYIARGLCKHEIRSFRSAMGMSRAELARLMHVSDKSIYLWERGEFPPSPVMWFAFVRVRANYRRKMKRLGKDLDGGPVMEDR